MNKTYKSAVDWWMIPILALGMVVPVGITLWAAVSGASDHTATDQDLHLARGQELERIDALDRQAPVVLAIRQPATLDAGHHFGTSDVGA